MSREEKITRLCRAIRAYRGISRGKDPRGNRIWAQTPQPSQRSRVIELLKKIGLDAEEMVLIDDFQTFEQYHQWVKTIT